MTLRSDGTTFALQRTVTLSSGLSPFISRRYPPIDRCFSPRFLQLRGVCDHRQFAFALLFTLDVSNSLASLITTSKCPSMITEMHSTTTEINIPAYSCNDRADRFFELTPFLMLETLQIGNDCFSEVYRFEISGLPALKSIIIGKNCFTQQKNDHGDNPHRSFSITDCPSLEIITIGRYSFSDYSGPFVIRNCNMLKHLKIGEIGSESCNFFEADFVLEGRNGTSMACRTDLAAVDRSRKQGIQLRCERFAEKSHRWAGMSHRHANAGNDSTGLGRSGRRGDGQQQQPNHEE